jgi:hypothetical protein
MPFDPISWAVIALYAIDAALIVGSFWEEIKKWFDRILGYIIDGLIKEIESATKATAFLVYKGTRFYKKIEVIVRNVVTGKYFKRYQEEEISPYDLDEQTKSQLSANPNLPVYQYQVR